MPAFIPKKNRGKFGWCLYDWANSAFATTILAAILPLYFAEIIVPEQGVKVAFMGFKGYLGATSLWGYASGLTSFFILISAPALGGIADRTNKRKTFLMVFCYSGALLTVLLFFSGPGDIFYTLLLFCLAHYFFIGGNVFYDSFLPYLAKGKDMDRLSGQGYALGYLGGGLILALSILFIQFGPEIGVPKEMSIRIALASAGIWWALFATISFLWFRETKGFHYESRTIYRAVLDGVQKTWEATRMIARHKDILIFLLAYMIYNDGVQTVIKMAAIYGKDELHLSTGTLLGTLLMVQFAGIGGALLMSRISQRFGTRQTIMGALLVWLCLTIFAYTITSALEYWILGFIISLILGGTQALSRSFYGGIIPKDQSAQYFGYFSVFAKFSAIWGPILFAFIRQVTGTARLSVLSLSLFFLVGWILLWFVEERKPS